MDAPDLADCYQALGVGPGVTLEELERAYLKKNFALIKGRAGSADEIDAELESQRRALRARYDRLAGHLRDTAQPGPAAASGRSESSDALPAAVVPPLPAVRRRQPEEFALLAFDNWKVNAIVPPLLLGFVWLVNRSPFSAFLQGFHVWMHEFGHATAAWMTGRRATPLPFGWTPVEPDFSPFVYWGLLFLFVVLFAAGWKERKIWAMLAAVALAGLQAFMTWRLPEHRQEFWWGAFGGVGGEFYLSTLFMMAFFVPLPEKFKWGGCRYVFFFIGATAFLAIWTRWTDVYRGIEEIPFGSMINGEEDAGGDMNKLMDDYGWKKFDIRRNYYLLGKWCWAALAATWIAATLWAALKELRCSRPR